MRPILHGGTKKFLLRQVAPKRLQNIEDVYFKVEIRNQRACKQLCLFVHANVELWFYQSKTGARKMQCFAYFNAEVRSPQCFAGSQKSRPRILLRQEAPKPLHLAAELVDQVRRLLPVAVLAAGAADPIGAHSKKARGKGPKTERPNPSPKTYFLQGTTQFLNVCGNTCAATTVSSVRLSSIRNISS